MEVMKLIDNYFLGKLAKGDIMKSVEISGDIDSKRELLMSLFRTNRKAASDENHMPFLIEKIKTKNTTYEVNETQCLKLTEDALGHVLMNNDFELVEFYINLRKEDVKITVCKDVFSVSSSKTEDLESEIIERIEREAQKGIS